MKQRTLGKSGLRVSVIGLGGNNFGGRADLEGSRAVIHKALDLGINLIDTAESYPMGKSGVSEEYIGQILGDRRKDVVIATKFGNARDGNVPCSSRRAIVSSAEASLRRLRTDWIDLYQIHKHDPVTPIEETLRALDDLVRQGKVRYIGCSNFASWQVTDAVWTSRSLGLNGIVSCQDEYSLLARGIERELIPAMQHLGLGLIPYFPLASGLLTGKYRRNAPLPQDARLTHSPALAKVFLTDSYRDQAERLEKFCAERGRSLLELAFSWLLGRPAVASVIAGATRPEQIDQNARAADWTLSADELAETARIVEST